MAGDAHLLANALRNLIGNSWKFSAQKPEVVLEIARDPQGPEGFTTVRLADQGAGGLRLGLGLSAALLLLGAGVAFSQRAVEARA